MSAAYPAPAAHDPGAGADTVPDPARAELRADLRAGLSIVAALAVIGALLGLVWAAWSPTGSAARITPAGRLQEESEAWIAADGRFLVLAAAAGLIAALAAWRRVGNRGPVMLAALAFGGLGGAALMWLVGWLTGGGSDNGDAQGFIVEQRTTVHVTGLVFVEAGVAVLVYGLLVAFAARDDLGRADDNRDRLLAARAQVTGQESAQVAARPQPYPHRYPAAAGEPSVGPGDHPQHGGRDGDAAGPLQQRDLPPQ